MDDFGSKLKTLRVSKQWRQHQLAAAVGVSVQAVSQWERGENYPEMGRLKQIAEALGASIFDLAREYSPEDVNKKSTTFDVFHVPIVRFIDVDWLLHGTSDDTINLKNVLGVTTRAIGLMFAVEVLDDRMVPLLKPGDFAIFDAGITPVSGDCVIARIDDRKDAVIGRYGYAGHINDRDVYHIQALNADYPTQKITEPGTGEVFAVLVERHSFFARRRKMPWDE